MGEFGRGPVYQDSRKNPHGGVWPWTRLPRFPQESTWRSLAVGGPVHQDPRKNPHGGVWPWTRLPRFPQESTWRSLAVDPFTKIPARIHMEEFGRVWNRPP